MPNRVISGLAAKFSRSAHGLRYDELHDEIVTTNPFAQAILTFRGGASGNEAPIRIIQGSRTQYKGSDRVDVDPVHDEIFIADDDQILVFPRMATGNVAPIRVIKVPHAGPIAVDPVRNLIVVYGRSSEGQEVEIAVDPLDRHPRDITTGSSRAGALRIYNRTDNGNVKPRAVIEGPKTMLASVNQIQVYPPKGWILVSLRPAGRDFFAGVWSINDNGDVPPRWVLGDVPMGRDGPLKPGRTIALDPQHKEVFATAYGPGGAAVLLRYSFPELF